MQQIEDKYLELTATLDKLTSYYQHCLRTSEEALDYITKRELSEEMLEQFRIGFAPSPEKVHEFLVRNNLNVDHMFETGTWTQHDGEVSDRFVGRLMFPIIDLQGRVVGYSARALHEGSSAKYVNTSTSVLFRKRAQLYGLYQALLSGDALPHVIVVEGNVDVISMHQAGFTQTVAGCGTAITEEHLLLLRALNVPVLGFFDNDDAGKIAKEKVAELAKKLKVVYFNVSVEGGKDADEILKKQGPEKITQAIDAVFRRNK